MITHYVKDFRDDVLDGANKFLQENFAKDIEIRKSHLRKVL